MIRKSMPVNLKKKKKRQTHSGGTVQFFHKPGHDSLAISVYNKYSITLD